GLAEALRARGVPLLEQREVEQCVPWKGGWRLTTADGGDELADRVVVAAGAWSARVLARVGVRIPLEAAKGYSLTAAPAGPLPLRPLYLLEARVRCSPVAR